MGASRKNSGGNRSYRPDFNREIELDGSDLVRSVQFDNNKGILDVTLTDGQRYRYRDVGPEVFAYLITARSPGKIFNSHIKSYPCRKLTKST